MKCPCAPAVDRCVQCGLTRNMALCVSAVTAKSWSAWQGFFFFWPDGYTVCNVTYTLCHGVDTFVCSCLSCYSRKVEAGMEIAEESRKRCSIPSVTEEVVKRSSKDFATIQPRLEI